MAIEQYYIAVRLNPDNPDFRDELSNAIRGDREAETK
jgi:hypothetical protein